MLRFLILIGLFFLFTFIRWFVFHVEVENVFLYSLLAVSFSYKILHILYEWLHFYFISTPKKPNLKPNFSVDVFTTYVPGEPKELIKETLLAIKNIRYPHNSILCSEAEDEELKSFCISEGIQFIHRIEKVGAKAGNINNALKQTSGDVVVIFDPDHQPCPEFLDEVLPYFDDFEIGIVQTVQGYRNKDENLVTKGASQETFHFYGPLMMGMNTFGTVQAIGANSVFRRKALDDIGGHSAGLTEDMHTSMNMHSKGWKSIYLPQILNKGLVPFTYDSYVHQQLKWTRGALDLLKNKYAKLSKGFSLAQKFHYLFIPLYFLKGFIHLVDFIIPSVCLVLATTPITTRLDDIFWEATPLFFLTFLIRITAQHYFSEKEEKGFHFASLFLKINTSWVNVLGAIYTVMEKNVPFIPTEKSNKSTFNIRLYIPNFILIGIGLLVMFTGLQKDFTPYSIFFACMLGVQVFIFTIGFILNYSSFNSGFLNNLNSFLSTSIRKISLLSGLVIILAFTSFQLKWFENFKTEKVELSDLDKTNEFYVGMYSPSVSMEEISHQNLNTYSFYSSWNISNPDSIVNLLNDLQQKEIYPHWTIEPWPDSIGENVCEQILTGKYDEQLHNIKQILKKSKVPMFIRFLHEVDNPQYPWYTKNSKSYKMAYEYIHYYFSTHSVNNLTWVYTPWKPENAEKFYPGDEYVDWIGLNILNYDVLDESSNSFSFADYYEAFRYAVLGYEKPILVSEFGAYNTKSQSGFITEALRNLHLDFPEIKGLIFFNSAIDKNTAEYDKEVLDWSITNEEFFSFLDDTLISDFTIQQNQVIESVNDKVDSRSIEDFKAINYNSNNDWKDIYKPLTRKLLLKDFSKIKEAGANMIYRNSSSVYDYNVFNIAEEKELGVIQNIYLPPNLDYSDLRIQDSLKMSVLNQIKELSKFNSLKVVNLGNGTYTNIYQYFYVPKIYTVRKSYLNLINELAKEIKQKYPKLITSFTESQREHFLVFVKEYQQYCSNIDILGVNSHHLNNLQNLDSLLNTVNYKGNYWVSEFGNPEYFDSKNSNLQSVYTRQINSKSYYVNEQNHLEKCDDISAQWETIQKLNKCKGASVFCWQDQIIPTATWSGLSTYDGKLKPEYYQLKTLWNSFDSGQTEFLKLEIINPTITFFENKTYKFSLNKSEIEDFEVTWQVTNEDGYVIFEEKNSGEFTYTIPNKIRENLRLTVYFTKGEKVWTAHKFLKTECVYFP